jgi:hypothetical protein
VNLPPLSAIVQKTHDKTVLKAQRKGVDTSDALLVLEGIDDSSIVFLVIRPDRVEAHNMGKMGTLTHKGRGMEEIGIQRISSVEVKKAGMLKHEVRVYTSGNTLTAPLPAREMAEAARATISALMNGAAATGATQPAPTPAAAPAPPAASTPPPPPPPGVPADWYPDGAVQRYWDGTAWTEHTAPLPPSV